MGGHTRSALQTAPTARTPECFILVSDFGTRTCRRQRASRRAFGTYESLSATGTSIALTRLAREVAYAQSVHIDTLSGPERRVLGCLIEKRFTTPDQYPLTVNALRLACNQSTNRDPVVDYGEETVREAAQRLARYGLTRLASGHSSRAVKYRHMADELLGLGHEQLAVLAVLLLRGPQTPGELKARSERMAELASLAEVDRVLSELISLGYVRQLDRRPGQKEERFADVLGEPYVETDPVASRDFGTAAVGRRDLGTALGALRERPASGPADEGNAILEARVASLEAKVVGLEEQVAVLTAELRALRDELS